MKNQYSQSRYTVLKTLAASIAMVFLCSCTSTVYDMRQLDQPVVLNNNPFLISGTAPSPKLVKIDTYSAEVVNGASSSGDTGTTSEINTTQLNAFLKIGGDPNCSIRNVTLDTTCGQVFLIFLVGAGADIDATGEVAQIQAPLRQPIRGLMGQSLNNQSALSSTTPK